MINICWVNPDKYKIYISLEFPTWQIFYFYGYHIAICLEEVFIEISDSASQVNLIEILLIWPNFTLQFQWSYLLFNDDGIWIESYLTTEVSIVHNETILYTSTFYIVCYFKQSWGFNYAKG